MGELGNHSDMIEFKASRILQHHGQKIGRNLQSFGQSIELILRQIVRQKFLYLLHYHIFVDIISNHFKTFYTMYHTNPIPDLSKRQTRLYHLPKDCFIFGIE